jgi:hypothetical protein
MNLNYINQKIQEVSAEANKCCDNIDSDAEELWKMRKDTFDLLELEGILVRLKFEVNKIRELVKTN